ncbi:MAG: TRAP transporter small permease subunit [Elusimicrobiota bacterium]|nr:TRAP transporter small permease subunit [Elusimicrobiota bacterium]
MKKFYETFCRIEEIICGIGFISLVSLIFLSAILRGMSMSLSWNIDVALLLLAWSSFLGADCAFRSGQLVGIDLFTRSLPSKTKAIVEIAVLFLILALLIFLLIFGSILVTTDWSRQYNSLPISFSWAVLSLPVMSFSMSISAILKIKQRFANLRLNN